MRRRRIRGEEEEETEEKKSEQNKGQEWVKMKRSCHFLHSLRNDLTETNARYNLGDLYYIELKANLHYWSIFIFTKKQKCSIKGKPS